MTAGTDWVKHLVDDAVQELLAGTITDTTLHILLLQLVQSLELWPELSEVLRSRECLQISEHGIALQMSWLFHAHAWLTVRHLLHLLPNGLLVIAHIDAVAETLAHLLLTIGSRKATAAGNLWKQDLWFYQYRRISLVEAANQLAGYLQHRLLVLTGRHGCSLESGDVGSLAHRIAEETERNVCLEVTHLDLSLHSWVTLNTRYRDEVHQIGSQLSQLWNHTLDIECTLLWIETRRKIIECYLCNVLANLLRIVSVICQSLNVCHKYEHSVKVTSILKLYSALQGTDVVTQVKFTCWTVARQYNLSHFSYDFIFLGAKVQ